ncbi:MAG: class I SAM-dependent methyltransferase, partial [Thermoanaerobaculia bacterium]
WSEAFERNADAVRQMYDESFVRKWRFYLRGCAASFRYGDSCLFQIQITRGLKNDLPLTRDYLYREADEELAKEKQYAMS